MDVVHISSSHIPRCVYSAVKGVVVLYAQLSQRCEEAEALAEALRIEKEAVAARLAATEERLQSAIASGKDTENAALAENERRAVALNEVGFQGIPSSTARAFMRSRSGSENLRLLGTQLCRVLLLWRDRKSQLARAGLECYKYVRWAAQRSTNRRLYRCGRRRLQAIFLSFIFFSG